MKYLILYLIKYLEESGIHISEIDGGKLLDNGNLEFQITTESGTESVIELDYSKEGKAVSTIQQQGIFFNDGYYRSLEIKKIAVEIAEKIMDRN